MLQRAAIIGNRLSVIQVGAALLTTDERRVPHRLPPKAPRMTTDGNLGGNLGAPPQVRAFLMKTLFEEAHGGYTNEHENVHLAFGDFVELLARAADEYFRSSKALPQLVDRLRLVIEHVHRSVYEAGVLPALKEPRGQARPAAPPPPPPPAALKRAGKSRKPLHAASGTSRKKVGS